MDSLLPIPELEVSECALNANGESNTIHRIRGRYQGTPLTAYLKRSKNLRHCLANEYAILEELASTDVPVPRVVWVSEERDALLLEAIDGILIWDLIDHKREHYDESSVLTALREYGEMLGRIHRLTPECSLQPRTQLYGFIGEEKTSDQRFREIIDWLKTHKIKHKDYVFVHGDYHTGNVILRDGVVSGIVDWEYAGSGWKEYELAWALRARMTFLNTPAEREAFLQGYYEYGALNAEALRWCEVMNYLHDAYWSLKVSPAYTDLSTTRALELIG